MIGQYVKNVNLAVTQNLFDQSHYLGNHDIEAKLNSSISWDQLLKWRRRQIYQDLKKALEITSHFIIVNLIYKAVSTECGTLKLTFIQLKTPQPIRFANHNSIHEVANAKRGKTAECLRFSLL